MSNSSPPNNPSLGERRLAAIMFTDVVSFSARIQQSENLTLRLVQRDFKAITNACNTCGGQVLKTTGDGLLMAFPTAGAAVDCALRVQKMIANSSKTLPPEQMLEHRIGIHLGDVFVADNDVMGNDVNIAARVLSEAGGGEICVSQTVYDVVKHRLSVKGIYIGERELKNIKEPVSIFRLPTSADKGRPPQSKHSRSRRNRQLAGAGILIAAIAAFAIWKFTVYQKPDTTPIAMPVAQPIIAPPATTRSAVHATAKIIDKGRRGFTEPYTYYGKLGGLIIADQLDLLPEHPFPIKLEPGVEPAQFTIVDGTIFRPPNQLRGGQPRGRGLRVLTSIQSTTTIKMNLHFPDDKLRQVTIGAVDTARDPNDEPRVQSIWVRDPGNNELLAQEQFANFREGLLLSVNVSGDIDIIIKREKGLSAVLQGIFIDPAR